MRRALGHSCATFQTRTRNNTLNAPICGSELDDEASFFDVASVLYVHFCEDDFVHANIAADAIEMSGQMATSDRGYGRQPRICEPLRVIEMNMAVNNWERRHAGFPLKRWDILY